MAPVIEQRLPLAHHTQRRVVDNGHFDRDFVDGAGGQFLVGHLETTIPIDSPHQPIGLGNLSPHGCWHGIAHGPCTARVQPGVRALVFDELGCPHLVLSHTRSKHRFWARHLTNLLDNPLRGQQTIVWFIKTQRVLLFEEVQPLPPGGVVGLVGFGRLVERRQQILQHVFDIAHDRDFSVANFANLCWVNVDVDDFGVWGKLTCFTGHAVIKTSPQHNQKI